MPFVYTPKEQVEYGDYWHEHNRERAEKTPKVDLSQIPSFNEIYTQAGAALAQAARQAEIEAGPYSWHGEGLPMTPQEKERWKAQFFAEKEH